MVLGTAPQLSTSASMSRTPDSEAPSSSSTTAPLEFDAPAAAAEINAAALDLKVARRLFYGGFAGLPWLWFIAWLHFRHAARLPSADPRLATYARRSGVGAIIGGLLFLAWIIYVQMTWRDWSEGTRRSLMLVVPEEYYSEEL